MTGLLNDLAARIEERGPMPFAAFMAHALYQPDHGYYSSGAIRTGAHGHFLTSPELDPAFGQLWCRAFEEIWMSCGEPARFVVAEIGPGEGGFVRALLDAATGHFEDALEIVLVERVPAAVERQKERLKDREASWVASVTEIPAIEEGVIVANEVLDNLPVHLVQKVAGELRELCVDLDGGKLALTALPPSSPELAAYLERCSVDLPEGHRYEIGLAAESLVKHAGRALRRGALVFVDYGATAGELAMRAEGTLVTYSASGTDDDVLAEPGARDITSHANWTAVARACRDAGLEPHGPVMQRDVLKALGVAELKSALRSTRDEAIAEGQGAAAVRALSRGQAIDALLDPGGLGGLDVLVGTKNLPAPAWIRGPNATEAGG